MPLAALSPRRPLLALCLVLATLPAAAQPARYEVDPDHLTLGFLVDHLGYAKVLGQFLKARGSYSFDEATGQIGAVRVEVETASVTTQHNGRDRHVKGGDFLNSAEHPRMVFSAPGGKRTGERQFEIAGTLELLGRSQPLVLQATWNKSAPSPITKQPTMGVLPPPRAAASSAAPLAWTTAWPMAGWATTYSSSSSSKRSASEPLVRTAGPPQGAQHRSAKHEGIPVNTAWAQGLRVALPLLLLNALLTLVNPGPTPWPQLTARVAPELCLALVLAACWSAWRGRVPLRALALATALLVAVRTLEITAAALFGRPLHLFWDGRHLGQMLTMQGTPWWQIAVALFALLALLLGLYALARQCWRAIQHGLVHRTLRRGVLLLSAALLTFYAVQQPGSGTPTVFAGAITPVVARQVQLAVTLLQDRGSDARLTPSPAFDTDLAGLHGADVLLLFSESYGVSTLDDPHQARQLASPRAALARAIAASGRQVVSARVRSPTYAGGSWLAHGALLSGVDTQDPLDYEILLSTQRRTLVQHFGAHGWRTVSWMPGLQRPWPEGHFFGFARYVDADNMGYAGLPFGPWRIPDQAAMALLHAQELAAPATPGAPRQPRQPRQPRFIVFPTVNSHVPFRPIAPFVADWGRLAGQAPYTPEQRAQALDEPASLRDPVPAYVQSIASTWEWLGAYLVDRAPPRLFTLVLGDHQAFAGVSGAGASWDVPVHVISDDARLLQRFEAAGFTPGLEPRGPALGGMHTLTELLLAAWGGV